MESGLESRLHCVTEAMLEASFHQVNLMQLICAEFGKQRGTHDGLSFVPFVIICASFEGITSKELKFKCLYRQ